MVPDQYGWTKSHVMGTHPDYQIAPLMVGVPTTVPMAKMSLSDVVIFGFSLWYMHLFSVMKCMQSSKVSVVRREFLYRIIARF